MSAGSDPVREESLEGPVPAPPQAGDLPWMQRFYRSRFGRGALVALVVVALALAVDGVRAPKDQLGVKLGLAAVSVYQATASPALGWVGVQCRFQPTCSHYGRSAIEHRGLLPGAWLAVRRVARCGPWTEAGTVDPPPQARAVR